ncbi:fluoride efflux transporter FluC [Actinoalloteichus hymeniacidonis]|uniref:Fluoride-specific ion channel FluC n=1 Tax=Actinoalloteichus hymeniacidonis TaxID=340345 RepID=A0AAC9MVK3_9PSEU|nr:CrcB family protein [Actinoalloteichus hymeniacidonis]AOS61273.1 putative membrane protein [Actinoalloteichus hymeniacidonis]MBB5910724.1 CrcB protein [Actinoalloteichus hymeniacidonis]
MINVLLIAVAGAVGAVLRHLAHALLHREGPRVAWPTLLVNGIGTLLLAALGSAGAAESIGVVLGVGFCGAFTTYATFAAQTVALAEQGHRWQAALNVGLNLVVGVIAVALGTILGQQA